MTARIAALLGGVAGFLTLVWNVAAISYHFDSTSTPVKIALVLIALAIVLFVLMFAFEVVRHLLIKAWKWIRQK